MSAVRVKRLAVSNTAQGRGHDELLPGHAVNLALPVQQTMGVPIAGTRNVQAVAFCGRFGFRGTVSAAQTLYLPISAARRGMLRRCLPHYLPGCRSTHKFDASRGRQTRYNS